MGFRFAVIGAAAICLFAACGGSSSAGKKSGGNDVLSVVAATQSTDSLRYETDVRSVEDGKVCSECTRKTVGSVDFAQHAGSATQSNSDLSGGSDEFRWMGTRSYEHLSEQAAKLEYSAPSRKTWIETDNGALRSAVAGSCLGLADPLSGALGVSSRSFTPVDPGRLLDLLRAAGATLVRIGPDTVRGTATTHWRVDTDTVTTTTVPPKCSSGIAGLKQDAPGIEVWTDAQDRLRRIEFTTKSTITNPVLSPTGFNLSNSGPKSVIETSTTDLFDFGVRVSVAPPPADQVYDVTAEMVAVLTGPGVVSPNGWRDAAHGSFRGKSWTVWFARTSTQWYCYQTDGVPASEQQPLLGADAGMPTHDGHAADCAPSPGGLFENGPFTAILGGADGDRWVLIGRVDDAANDARLVFSDGSSTALTIDPDTRLVQWTGSVTPAPSKIVSGGYTCSFDGRGNQCQGAFLDSGLPSGPLPPGITITGGVTLPTAASNP